MISLVVSCLFRILFKTYGIYKSFGGDIDKDHTNEYRFEIQQEIVKI